MHVLVIFCTTILLCILASQTCPMKTNWKTNHISSNISFDRVIETGHLLSNQYYKLFYAFKNNGACRLGISLPKSVISKAHDRNRLKRVIRNSMDPLKKEKLDLVFLLKKNRVQYSKNDDMIVRDHLIRDSKTILLKKDNDGIS